MLIVTLVVLAVLAVGGLLTYQYFKRTPAQVASTGTGISAFARLAEADGKIIALKAAAEVKKAEAIVQAAAVEEIHKILG